MKLKKIFWEGASVLLLLTMLNIPAFATLKVTFPTAINANQIDLFWSGDASTPDQTSPRTVSTSVSADISATLPAKPDTTPPSLMYLFWAGTDPVASQSTYIRLWDDGTKPLGAHYTDLWGLASNNPGGAVSEATFANSYSYIKAAAAKAVISSCNITKTLTYYPTLSTVETVQFNSIQPKNGIYNVQVKSTQWEVNGVSQAVGTGMSFSFPTAAYPLTAGLTYTVRVKHLSYFSSTWGEWSDPQAYTVGSAASSAPVKFNYALKQYVTGNLNVNDMAPPFDTDALSLAASIDAQAKASGQSTANVTYAICKFDPNANTVVTGAPTNKYFVFLTPLISYRAKSSNFAIKKGEGVQVYVTQDTVVTLESVSQ